MSAFFRLRIFLTSILAITQSSYLLHAGEVAFESDHGLPLVYLNTAFQVGTVSDPIGQLGLTNFMGEMLLRGTKSHTKAQLDLALDQIGARLEAETRAEAIIFRSAVLSTQMKPFLKLITEILTQPSFEESEIKKLKDEMISVIQEELGHDGSLASRKFSEFLFQGHPYGKPTLGKVADIQNLTRNQIVAHYNRVIRERFLLVVGTGDASEDVISAWSENLAKARPNTPLSAEDQKILTPVEAPQTSESRRLLIVDKPDRTQTQVYFGQVGVRMTSSDFFPLYLGNHAFGGPTFTAIMMTEIRVKRGWSYGATTAFKFGLQPRIWQGHLFPSAQDTPPALEYSLKLVTDLQQNGLTLDQFEFAQNSVVTSSGFMYNTPKKRVENKLLEKTLDLPDGFMKTFGAQVSKLKLSEVNQALKSFIKPDRQSIVVLGTAKKLKAPLAAAASVPLHQVKVLPYNSP